VKSGICIHIKIKQTFVLGLIEMKNVQEKIKASFKEKCYQYILMAICISRLNEKNESLQKGNDISRSLDDGSIL
jgi:hypothetical protein